MNANKICLNVSKTELDLFRSARKQLDFGLKLKLNGKRATSPRAIPLVLALLCGNCPLTLTYLFIIFSRLLLVYQFFVVNISQLFLSEIDFIYFLTYSYTIHSYICTVQYIVQILYLLYTCILIQPLILHLLCFHLIACITLC